jgi:outer membrane protein
MVPKFAWQVIVLALCLVSGANARAEMKVGTVDVERVLKEYSKTKEAEAKLNEARNAAKKEYDDRTEAYKKALDEINKLNSQLGSPALTTDAKASKAKERDERIASIKKMEREIDEFRQTREQQLQQQMLRMRESLLKEVTDVVLERTKSKNLDLVFEKSGLSSNRVSPILFSLDGADFTAEVIAQLNKKERGTSPTPSEKQAANRADSPNRTKP